LSDARSFTIGESKCRRASDPHGLWSVISPSGDEIRISGAIKEQDITRHSCPWLLQFFVDERMRPENARHIIGVINGVAVVDDTTRDNGTNAHRHSPAFGYHSNDA